MFGNRARYDWLVDIGRTSLSRGFPFYLTAAYFQQRLTPYSLGCCHPHTIGSDGRAISDSTVFSTWECLTHMGSEGVPLNRKNGLSIYMCKEGCSETILPIPPIFEKMGFLRGIS